MKSFVEHSIGGWREWLAAKISPSLAEDAALYRFQRNRISEAWRWLGEFPHICALIEWLNGSVVDWARSINEPPSGSPWDGDIGQFREQLRGLSGKPEGE